VLSQVIYLSTVWSEIRLDAPATGNALSPALVASVSAALESVDARVVTLASTGSVFCGGFDLSLPIPGDEEVAGRFLAIQQLLDLLREAPFVTVACVDGPAYGAGADLVAACDYRLATSRARFRFPGGRFGIVLGLERLIQVVGADAARDIVLRNRVITADEALALGLVTTIVDDPHSCVPAIVEGVAGLDDPTLRAVLGATRGTDRPGDAALLRRSAAHPGLAERLRAYAGGRSRPGGFGSKAR
jgi:enoyl-CoA hydratase/carnithine racemase